MASTTSYTPQTIARDLLSGLIVFLVALPLCLGIALASNAPLFSGLIAGIIGGIVVGMISGSHTSVSGPAAGLTAIVAAQIADLKTFDTFLLALVIGGVLQIVLGAVRAGALSAFFPSSVIKGLLAAIGVILILKQIPHLLGHDKDPQGEMSFEQPDHENTFTELLSLFTGDVHIGAMVLGVGSLAFLMLWDVVPRLKKSLVPAPLIVVILGVVVGQLFSRLGAPWFIDSSHLVQVPIAETPREFLSFLTFPKFSEWLNPAVYAGAVTIAIVASLETLLNLDAVDKLDRKQRISPPSRELVAQGVGNVMAGLIGGIPMTSVVIRGSVNVHAGSETKLSTIFHGILLLVCVALLPTYLNLIPLSCLAAILLLTGYKLANPKLFKQMWKDGPYQFAPFILTLVSIVLTDLLIGIVIGLLISIVFILYSNLRRPIHRIHEKHVGGDVMHIELANQVSFLNRAALESVLREAPRGSRILIDARRTDYIDPDILSLIRDFVQDTAPVYEIQVSLVGFQQHYKMVDSVETVDLSPREMRDQLTPEQALVYLREGNRRFSEGHPLDRNLRRQPDGDESETSPFVAVLTGMDTRAPVELVFDLDIGDAYVIRTPANVVLPTTIGGLEFACMDGVKIIVVMGHTKSRPIRAAIEHLLSDATNTQHNANSSSFLAEMHTEVRTVLDTELVHQYQHAQGKDRQRVIDQVTHRIIERSARRIIEQSSIIRQLEESGQIQVVAAMYSVETGAVEFYADVDAADVDPVGAH